MLVQAGALGKRRPIGVSDPGTTHQLVVGMRVVGDHAPLLDVAHQIEEARGVRGEARHRSNHRKTIVARHRHVELRETTSAGAVLQVGVATGIPAFITPRELPSSARLLW